MTASEWGIVAITLLAPIGAVLWLRPPPGRRNMDRVRVLAQQKGFKVRLLREQDVTSRFGDTDGRMLVEYTLPREPDAPAIEPFIWSRKVSDADACSDTQASAELPPVIAQFGLESAVYSLSLAPARLSLTWTEKMEREDVEPFLQSLLALSGSAS